MPFLNAAVQSGVRPTDGVVRNPSPTLRTHTSAPDQPPPGVNSRSSGPQFSLPSFPKLEFPQFFQSPNRGSASMSASSTPQDTGNGMAADAVTAASGAADAEPEGVPQLPPEELLVLVHGLQGTSEDFTFFADQLRQTVAGCSGRLLVHVPLVNEQKTHDGVEVGGKRLAADIRRVVSEHPSLRRISLVGFSLGGMHIRYAAGVLYDKVTSTIAGLQPQTFATVASPNLGVRRFGVFRLIPKPLFGATKFLLGQTGDDLVLNDDREELIAVSMSKDSNPLGLPFISALKSFSKRYLYGNMRQDFMVNWGTSVLDSSVQKIAGNDLQAAILENAEAAGAIPIDDNHDEKGCKVAFTYKIPVCDTETSLSSLAASVDAQSDHPIEDEIAARLRSVGWEVVGIDLPMPVPFAHNRIMAMSRGPVHSWMNAPGRRAVIHLVDTLVGTFDCHERVFEPVLTGNPAPEPGGSPPPSQPAVRTPSPPAT